MRYIGRDFFRSNILRNAGGVGAHIGAKVKPFSAPLAKGNGRQQSGDLVTQSDETTAARQID